MTVMPDHQPTISDSRKSLTQLCVRTIANLGSTLLTATFLGLSYFGLLLATTFARKLFESLAGPPRKL
jgi:hypothetical protein